MRTRNTDKNFLTAIVSNERQSIQQHQALGYGLALVPALLLIVFTIFQLSGNFIHPEPFHDISRSDPYLTLQQATDDPLHDKIGQPDLHPSKEHLHEGKKAMVASDVPVCSTMGKEILLKEVMPQMLQSQSHCALAQ